MGKKNFRFFGPYKTGPCLKSYLAKEFEALKLNGDLKQSTQKNDIIISGIPNEISDSPQRIVNRVFSALKASDQRDS